MKKKGLNEIYSKATELYNKHGELEGSKLLKEWFKQNKNNLDIYSNNHYSNIDKMVHTLKITSLGQVEVDLFTK